MQHAITGVVAAGESSDSVWLALMVRNDERKSLAKGKSYIQVSLEMQAGPRSAGHELSSVQLQERLKNLEFLNAITVTDTINGIATQ